MLQTLHVYGHVNQASPVTTQRMGIFSEAAERRSTETQRQSDKQLTPHAFRLERYAAALVSSW